MVESERVVGEKSSTERRYFISSLPGDNAEQFGKAVRQHWQIESVPQAHKEKEVQDEQELKLCA
jgi:predicted transposase YbfD/YdcC